MATLVYAYVYDVSCPEVVEFWSATLYNTSSPHPPGAPPAYINCTAKPGYCYGQKIILNNGKYILWLRNAKCWANPAIADLAGGSKTITIHGCVRDCRADEVQHELAGSTIDDVVSEYHSKVRPSGRYSLCLQWLETCDGGEPEVSIEGSYTIESDESES